MGGLTMDKQGKVKPWSPKISNHEDWLKTKKGRLVELLNDIKYPDNPFHAASGIDNLAAALSLLSKGTQYESEVKEIIEMSHPEFYKP